MPGSVQNAAPATVVPLSLCKSFVHERSYPLIENEYKNGESQRSVLATNSRRRWRQAKRLTPADRTCSGGAYTFQIPGGIDHPAVDLADRRAARRERSGVRYQSGGQPGPRQRPHRSHPDLSLSEPVLAGKVLDFGKLPFVGGDERESK
jgi:hypothetical protein